MSSKALHMSVSSSPLSWFHSYCRRLLMSPMFVNTSITSTALLGILVKYSRFSRIYCSYCFLEDVHFSIPSTYFRSEPILLKSPSGMDRMGIMAVR